MLRRVWEERGEWTYVVKIAPDNVHVGRERLEELEGILSTEVPGAQHVLDAPRDKQLLELLREIVRAVRDVDIADNQDKLRSGRSAWAKDTAIGTGPPLPSSRTFQMISLFFLR